MRPLSWLHISDLHLRQGTQWAQNFVLQEMCRHIEQQVESNVAPDFILVTGDIAFSGQADEYRLAEDFFDKLQATSGVPLDRIFCVPGNHDIDRSRHQNTFRAVRRAIRTRSDANAILENNDDLTALLTRQEHYRNFQESYFGGQDKTWTPEGLGYVARLNIQDVRLAIIGLDSAWIAEGGEGDHGKLLLGERQAFDAIDCALDKDEPPHVLIAMAHHPFRLLQEFDRMPIQYRLERDIQFFHHGHLHQAETRLGGPIGSQCLTVATGASFAGRENDNSYSVVTLDVFNATRSVRSFQYYSALGTYSLSSDEERYPISLTGTTTCGVPQLAESIMVYSPGLKYIAYYLAALILGPKTEFPIAYGDSYIFGAIEAARILPDNDLAESSVRLKNFKNILDIHFGYKSIEEILHGFGGIVVGFGQALAEACKSDTQLPSRLKERDQDARRFAGTQPQRVSFHTLDLLSELEQTQDWIELMGQAARHVDSPNELVATTAKRKLALALSSIGEPAYKREATEIYRSLSESQSAEYTDYANLALLLIDKGQVDDAERIVFNAIELFPEQKSVFIEVGQLIVDKTGDRALRMRIDQTVRGQA